MEQVTRNGNGYYIPFIPFVMSSQLLLNETNYFYARVFKPIYILAIVVPQFEDRLDYRSSSHLLPVPLILFCFPCFRRTSS